MSKEPRVTSDLSREEKIKRIYEIIMPTYNHIGNWMTYKNKCMIWDVLDWYWKKQAKWGFLIYWNVVIDFRIEKLFTLWSYKRKSIKEQSDQCIDYIYSLIK